MLFRSRIRQDLSQDKRVNGLPLGTVGGTSATYNFPVSGTYRLVTTLALTAAEYEDTALDSTLSSAAAITNAILYRPTRPLIAPSTIVPFDDTSIKDNPSATVVSRVYAISFVDSNNVEGPLSKTSGVVGVIDGTTNVRLSHIESVPTNYLKKRIYRQNITYTSGTYTVTESAFKLVS